MLILHDRADVAVDVIAVAQVEEPQRVTIARPRPSDGAEQQLVAPVVTRARDPAEATLRLLLETVSFPADMVRHSPAAGGHPFLLRYRFLVRPVHPIRSGEVRA